MARSDFVHLHTHTEYSMLDGAASNSSEWSLPRRAAVRISSSAAEPSTGLPSQPRARHFASATAAGVELLAATLSQNAARSPRTWAAATN